MGNTLRGKSAIIGIGLGGLGEATGRQPLEIMSEAVHYALADAGLSLDDVDGLFTGSAYHYLPTLSVGEYFGIKPGFSDGSMIGGSSFVAHMLNAALALDAGLCDVALIAYGSNQRTAGGRLMSMSEQQRFEAPYKPRYPITAYSLAASRHMHEFGTTREQLATVAVAARNWARMNPLAFARDLLTVDDVLTSRMVCDPLSILDCCLVTDGGAAAIMVRADRAKDHPQPPVYLLGCAMAHWHRQISEMPDLTVTAASDSGKRAFEMAGIAPAGVDVVELYDAFTINTILFLEDLGFCPKGEGGNFVASEGIGPGGKLPVNTNGGGLSFCHPGMYGLFTMIEAVEQLRGHGGDRQIDGANIAVAHGNGGTLSSQVTSVLGTAATL